MSRQGGNRLRNQVTSPLTTGCRFPFAAERWRQAFNPAATCMKNEQPFNDKTFVAALHGA
jgi:hypothetical protein